MAYNNHRIKTRGAVVGNYKRLFGTTATKAVGLLSIIGYKDNRLNPWLEGAGYFFLLRCLISEITSVIIATISKPKVSIIIIASNVVMACHLLSAGVQLPSFRGSKP